MRHKIILFFAIIVGTIVLIRFFVFVHNPALLLFNFELHHFDCGVLLLLISSQLLLFGPKNHDLAYLFLTAVASGLILDDYWFIRQSVVEYPTLQTQIYNATLPFVAILTAGAAIVALLIRLVSKNRRD